MKIPPEKRVHRAWSNLTFRQKVLFVALACFASGSYRLSEAIMKHFPRTIFIIVVIVYVTLLFILARIWPEGMVAAGIVLGAIIGALAIFTLMPRHNHNGNGNNHHE